MHDETFLVTQGCMQFHGLHGETIVANQGDYVTVPTRSPHTFSNPYDEEAKFFNTYTPAYYINYFKMLSKMGKAVSHSLNPQVPILEFRVLLVMAFSSATPEISAALETRIFVLYH